MTPDPPAKDSHVTAAGLRTRYRVVGRGGVPLVLLHGLAGTLDDWHGTQAALARHRAVIAVDLLGCGGTARPVDGGYGPEAMRAHVAATLEALSLGPVDLGGWSLGGRIALDLAHAAPDRVRRLVLTAPAGLGEGMALRLDAPLPCVVWNATTLGGGAGLRVLRNALRNGTGRRLARFAARRASLATDAGARAAARHQLRALFDRSGYLPGPRGDLLAKLPSIAAPALAIWGRQDRFAPFADAALLTGGMPRCTLHPLEDCGHMPHLEWPDRYVAAVEDFLA